MASRRRDREGRGDAVESRPEDFLHQCYMAGKLQVLVGAGISLASGFPNWDELSYGLLESHLRDKYADHAFATPDRIGGSRKSSSV